uniref:EGF-like domain-containing protein n=1 Tax=Eptatretus burgeri TaxID=7764 RepID=A0A8C4QLM0_EPTBU
QQSLPLIRLSQGQLQHLTSYLQASAATGKTSSVSKSTAGQTSGVTAVSATDTSQPGSIATTHVVSTASAATGKTSSVSKSTAGQTSGVTTVSATDTSQPGSIATTRVISTTMTTTEICDWQKCQKKCQMIPCQNGGTCSCIDAACTITCKCTSAFRGSRCEHGENIFLAQLRQDAPKVQFDMTVLFKLLDLKTSQKERMV